MNWEGGRRGEGWERQDKLTYLGNCWSTIHHHQNERLLRYLPLVEKHEQGFHQVHQRESCHDDLQETEFIRCFSRFLFSLTQDSKALTLLRGQGEVKVRILSCYKKSLPPLTKDIIMSAWPSETLVKVKGVTLLQSWKAFSMAWSTSALDRSGV